MKAKLEITQGRVTDCKRQCWEWVLVVSKEVDVVCYHKYRSKDAAQHAARTMAKNLGLTITKETVS